jgi:hypothetical protein
MYDYDDAVRIIQLLDRYRGRTCEFWAQRSAATMSAVALPGVPDEVVDVRDILLRQANARRPDEMRRRIPGTATSQHASPYRRGLA